MDMLSHIDNLDVMLGNGYSNPRKRELADANEQSSVQGDTESNTHLRDHYASFLMKTISTDKAMLDNPSRPFQMKLISDYLKRWTQ